MDVGVPAEHWFLYVKLSPEKTLDCVFTAVQPQRHGIPKMIYY